MHTNPPTTPTVADLVRHWRTVQGGRYAPRSLVERELILRRLTDALGDRSAAELRAGELAVWLDGANGWKSENTRHQAAVIVCQVFRLAHRHGLIGRNPAATLLEDFPAGERRRPVTWDEFRALLRSSSDALLKQFLAFLWFTGMRPGEVCALRWEELAGDRCLRLERHKTRRKTGKPRYVYLLPQARRLLAFLRRQREQEQRAAFLRRRPDERQLLDFLARQRAEPPAGLVFVNRLGNGWNAQSLCLRLARLREKAGIPRDCYFHGIRHSFGTNRVAEGAPIKLVSQLMGHRSVKTTEKYYLHLDGRTAEIADALDRCHQRAMQREPSHRKELS